MAISFLGFNDQLPHGRILRRCLQKLEEGVEEGNDVLAVMPHMIDGDGSDVSHFAEVVTRFGFASTTTAKAGYEELASMLGKLNTNASVSSVNAAMLQAFNKFRG